MTSENPSTEVPSPEQQFMLNVTRKKPQELSPRQDPNILASSSISFKDAIMHDMEVLEPTALPIREEGLELTMTEDELEEHAITLLAQVREKIYASWKSSIIIKVVGKSFGYIAKRLTHRRRSCIRWRLNKTSWSSLIFLTNTEPWPSAFILGLHGFCFIPGSSWMIRVKWCFLFRFNYSSLQSGRVELCLVCFSQLVLICIAVL